MNHNRKIFITSTALSFMYAALFRSAFNLICGYEDSSNIFYLQLILYLVTVGTINLLFLKMPFKNYLTFAVTEGLVMYPVFLAASYLFNWFSFRDWQAFLLMSLCFAGIYSLVVWHFYSRDRKEADDINSLIK